MSLRITKDNARQLINEAESMIEHYTQILVFKAGMTPSGDMDEMETIVQSVRNTVDMLIDYAIKIYRAERVLEGFDDE